MKISAGIAAIALATTVTAAEVTVEALGVTGESAKRPAPELHFFGGQRAEFDLAVEAPLGANVSLTAALFQLANGLAAPLNASISASRPGA